MLTLHPITLTGRVVRLEPLSETHVPDLTRAGQDEAIWRFMPYGRLKTEAEMRQWVLNLLERQAAGTDLPFAVIQLDSEQAVGATRFMEIHPQHRNLEIGGTWYAPAAQRTAVNTESKYLLLRYAFDVLNYVRVQFKADLRNERSQTAIARLGAVREGVLRHTLIMPDGYLRSSVYFSILAEEWPAVKAGLEAKLGLTPPPLPDNA
jgi:RimJ/RimL family protein N-acetyltransferase